MPTDDYYLIIETQDGKQSLYKSHEIVIDQNYLIGVANPKTRRQINEMIRTAADNISSRYGVDSAHRDFVTRFSLQLFDQLRPIHRLGQHARLLLEIASRIDDIGNFINQGGHYRHSAYIMEANPLIGLSDKDYC